MANDRLTTQQEMFLAVRMQYKTDADAAKAIGLFEQTPSKWKQRSELFRQRYDSLTEDVKRHTVKRLQGMFDQATGVLEELLSSDSDTVRLKAADAILSYGGMLKGGRVSITVQDNLKQLYRELSSVREDDVIEGEWEEKEPPLIEAAEDEP